MSFMRSRHELTNSVEDNGSDRELRLLSEIDRTPDANQRSLSRRVGIALGLTNLLLRNLAEKGYIRITRAGWKRWLYTLTPSGLSRRVQLTLAYVHRILDHYQTVRQMLRTELEPLRLNEESRIAVYGTGEFAELVYLGLKEIGIEEIDIFAPARPGGDKFLGMPVYDVVTLEPERYDRVVIAQLNGADAGLAGIKNLGVSPEKMVTFFAARGAREEV